MTRVQQGRRPRGPMATMRHRFATGVALVARRAYVPTVAVWRVWRLPSARFSVN